MDTIENKTFEELQIGDTASLVHRLSREDIELFAVMSGDVNPAHVDEDEIRDDIYCVFFATDFMHAGNAGMLQLGRSPSIAQERFGLVWVEITLAGHFDGHRALQFRVALSTPCQTCRRPLAPRVQSGPGFGLRDGRCKWRRRRPD